jgi:hypothetical protein
MVLKSKDNFTHNLRMSNFKNYEYEVHQVWGGCKGGTIFGDRQRRVTNRKKIIAQIMFFAIKSTKT